MKKSILNFTADKARKLTETPRTKVFKDLEQILSEIKDRAEEGCCNHFIEVEPKNVLKFTKELKKRGFRVFLDHLFCRPHLEVEW